MTFLKHLGAEQVVDVERADDPAVSVDDWELRDPVALHKFHRLRGERLGPYGPRIGCHHLFDTGAMDVDPAFEAAPQIAVGKDANEPPPCGDDGSHAQPPA